MRAPFTVFRRGFGYWDTALLPSGRPYTRVRANTGELRTQLISMVWPEPPLVLVELRTLKDCTLRVWTPCTAPPEGKDPGAP